MSETIVLYDLDELSDEARSRAIEDYRLESVSYEDGLTSLDEESMDDVNRILSQIYCSTAISLQPDRYGYSDMDPVACVHIEWELYALSHDAIGGHIPDAPTLSGDDDDDVIRSMMTIWNTSLSDVQNVIDRINGVADSIASSYSDGDPSEFSFNTSESASDELDLETERLKDELYERWLDLADRALMSAISIIRDRLRSYASDEHVSQLIRRDGIQFYSDGRRFEGFPSEYI